MAWLLTAWKAPLCSCKSPLSCSLAAEETSPKETALLFLPPSLSFSYMLGIQKAPIDQKDKEPFQALDLAKASVLGFC